MMYYDDMTQNDIFCVPKSTTTNNQFGGKIKKHIKYVSHIDFIDDDVFPRNLYMKYIKNVTLIGFHNILTFGMILCHIITKNRYQYYNINSELRNKMDEIIGKNIFSYTFEDNICMFFYEMLRHIKTINKNTTFLIFSKNTSMLDACVFLLKHEFNTNDNNKIFFCFCKSYIQNKNMERTQYVYEYIKNNNITYTDILEQFTNENISKLKQKIDTYDIVTYDIMNGIYMSEHPYMPYVYAVNHNLFTQIPGIILGLNHVKKGGTFLLYHAMFPKKYMIDIMAYIGQYFEQVIGPFIHDELTANISSDCVTIFLGYIGECELSILSKINMVNHKYNNEGKLFNIYLDNALGNNLDGIYKKHFDKSEKYFNGMTIQLLSHVMYGQKQLGYMIYQAITYLSRIGINIKTNFDIHAFFSKKITKKINNQHIIKNINMIDIKFTKLPLCDIIVNIPYNFDLGIELVSQVYEILRAEEKNYQQYGTLYTILQKNITNLCNELSDKYGVKNVNETWLKIYSLIHKTKLLRYHRDNDAVKIFHMCESSEDNVKALKYYIRNNTKIKKYIHTSHCSKTKNIKNPSKCDFGIDETGNIMDYKNLLYYCDKYGNYDGVMGNCDLTEIDVSKPKNLWYVQLLYALLLPKKHGFFVIKTQNLFENMDSHFLSLFYFVISKYKKVKICKSGVNFWSADIYYVGMGFRGLTLTEKDNILECLQHNTYIVKNIPVTFCEWYDNTILKLISNTIYFKHFLRQLPAFTTDEFHDITKIIKHIITKRNKKYIKKYLPHLLEI